MTMDLWTKASASGIHARNAATAFSIFAQGLNAQNSRKAAFFQNTPQKFSASPDMKLEDATHAAE